MPDVDPRPLIPAWRRQKRAVGLASFDDPRGAHDAMDGDFGRAKSGGGGGGGGAGIAKSGLWVLEKHLENGFRQMSEQYEALFQARRRSARLQRSACPWQPMWVS